jgi:DNA-binding beta-propeller fold protein YncE
MVKCPCLKNIVLIPTLVVLSTLVGIASLNRGAQTSRLSRKIHATKPPVAHYHVVHGWPILPENILALPHSITVDGKDNVWVADVALNQVFKFSHDGKLLLKLGERAVSGDDHAHFNRPSDVAVAPDGSFYVSDGYRNNRIMKFAPDGKFLFQWGTKGNGPGKLDLPHAIAFATGRVYVVDRGNKRIQVFDEEGIYLAEWKGPLLLDRRTSKLDATAQHLSRNPGAINCRPQCWRCVWMGL